MYEFSTFTHYTKLLCSCILTMNTKTKNTISFYHHLKKKKKLGYKSNKICTGLLCSKQQNSDLKKSKMI